MDNALVSIYAIAVLILSASAHEYMHGWMANRLGDPTARLAGRLTVNPLAHMDPVGSVLLPALLVFSGSPFVFGYAKPVPFNPRYMKNPAIDGLKVGMAGPFANLVIAAVFGLLLRFIPNPGELAALMLDYVIIINLVLLVFNLVPIPPLDGSKIIYVLIPPRWREKYMRLEAFGFFAVILFLLLGIQYVWIVVSFLYWILVGGKVVG